MRAMLSRLRARDAALFVLIAGLVAAGVFAAAREAGVGERADAGTKATPAEQRTAAQQQDGGEDQGTPPAPLGLTLSAPEICETLPAQGFSGGRSYQEDDGTWHFESYSTGWALVAETPVTWSVSGGAAPYTLQIDGEGRDAAGAYAGASGTASVSCALRSSGVFFPHPLDEEHRRYRTEPEVDSGLKTIRAVVTDGSGATAEASIAVYVILSVGGSGDILQSGETYRVFGTLLTVPEGVDHLGIGGMVESDGGGAPTFGLGIAGGAAGDGWVSLRVDDLLEVGRSTRAPGSEGGSAVRGASETALDARIDELVDSVGQLPSVDRTRRETLAAGGRDGVGDCGGAAWHRSASGR